MVNFYACFSQIIVWSMTFCLTSQVVFNEETKPIILAIIPISFSFAAIISPILTKHISIIGKNGRFFFILACARAITVFPILFVTEIYILICLYFLQCIFFHSSFPYEVAYITSNEEIKKRKKTSNWQISISIGKLSSPIITSYIVSNTSPTTYSFIMAGFCFLLILSSIRLKSVIQTRKDIKKTWGRFKETYKYKEIICMGIYFIPISLAASLYGVLIKDCGLNESQFAIILSISGFGNVIGATIYRNMNKKNNAKKNVLLYSSIIGAGFVTFGLAKSTSLTVESLYFSAFIVGISMSLMVIFIVEIIQKKYTGNDLITSSSLNNGAQVGFSIIGPAIMPTLHSHMSASAIFILCGILIIIMNVFNLFRMNKSS